MSFLARFEVLSIIDKLSLLQCRTEQLGTALKITILWNWEFFSQ